MRTSRIATLLMRGAEKIGDVAIVSREASAGMRSAYDHRQREKELPPSDQQRRRLFRREANASLGMANWEVGQLPFVLRKIVEGVENPQARLKLLDTIVDNSRRVAYRLQEAGRRVEKTTGRRAVLNPSIRKP